MENTEVLYELSEEQKRRIRQAQADYEAGLFSTHEDFMKELDEWFEEN